MDKDRRPRANAMGSDADAAASAHAPSPAEPACGLVDCAIIGAGPAGLTAAIYLQRFRRNIAIFDDGRSRARWIPKSHNCPGFAHGISGPDLLDRLHDQSVAHGVAVQPVRIASIERRADEFVLSDVRGGTHRARTVLLATGIVDVMPRVHGVREAIQCGAIRLCAICDAYEARDSSMACYGPIRLAAPHARFLRSFSTSVLLVPSDDDTLDDSECESLAEIGIHCTARAQQWHFDGRHCSVLCVDGTRHAVDVMYPVLGSHARSALATRLGARTDANGELIVSVDQQTSVPGLYGIGDIVSALNQISVAVGHAAIAATAIHRVLPLNAR
ncbi:MAG: NAD(P)/FAD-dependent oxidoreductase [Tahibacter sp.]